MVGSDDLIVSETRRRVHASWPDGVRAMVSCPSLTRIPRCVMALMWEGRLDVYNFAHHGGFFLLNLESGCIKGCSFERHKLTGTNIKEVYAQGYLHDPSCCRLTPNSRQFSLFRNNSARQYPLSKSSQHSIDCSKDGRTYQRVLELQALSVPHSRGPPAHCSWQLCPGGLPPLIEDCAEASCVWIALSHCPCIWYWLPSHV
ncbi:hypothetical protein OE88DRAFT_1209203 [Heliocybe sulcata]|uniref:Uncharacterized protein n=1 Tax=Heliocybe sulcata TaxID=5364 RepID=A0A5C3NC61_9AGAM|nr:hypothetical protein OE88DRAFT_1209203 [Heliocybe sulcata]